MVLVRAFSLYFEGYDIAGAELYADVVHVEAFVDVDKQNLNNVNNSMP